MNHLQTHGVASFFYRLDYGSTDELQCCHNNYCRHLDYITVFNLCSKLGYVPRDLFGFCRANSTSFIDREVIILELYLFIFAIIINPLTERNQNILNKNILNANEKTRSNRAIQ